MALPEEAKKLLQVEIKNLKALRSKIRHFFMGAVAGGALQVYRLKREMQEILAHELLISKSHARTARIKLLKKFIGDIESVVPQTTQKDIVLSNLAAESFSNAWANAHLTNSALDPDARLRKIVTTETARSFSDVTMEVADRYKLVRRWDAVLDERTCSFCRDMDGEETLPGERFANDLEPGWVHPNCRCIGILVLK